MRFGRYKLFEKRIIGPLDDILLVRWIFFRTPAIGVFLHKLVRSDHDRALHDHPWSFLSVVLKNGYREERSCGEIWRNGEKRFLTLYETHWPGAILWRPAEWRHRVIIDDKTKPAWTLVFVFRNRRKWGFWPSWKWCWWRTYDIDKGICEEEILSKNGDED